MSTATAPAPGQNKQADAQNAMAVVQAGTYVPVFMHKMAAAGFAPQNEAEAGAMLQMAAELREKYDQHHKSASSKVIAKAHNRMFGQQLAKQAAARQQNNVLDELAAASIQDPNISAALDVLIGMEA